MIFFIIFYVQVYPFLIRTLGYQVLFACHGVNIIMAALFVVFFLPETRNKSFSEIQETFKAKKTDA